jgi:hypothetical protein
MINISDYDEIKFLLDQLERLEGAGLDRFTLKGFQKHGDDQMEVPGDSGHFRTNEISWKIEELLSKAIMFDSYVATQKLIREEG